MTERLHFHFSLSCIGEGNGNPLQCSCLKNPRDGGAWWAAVYGVAQSQTRLKRLSSSSRLHCSPPSSLPLGEAELSLSTDGSQNPQILFLSENRRKEIFFFLVTISDSLVHPQVLKCRKFKLESLICYLL